MNPPPPPNVHVASFQWHQNEMIVRSTIICAVLKVGFGEDLSFLSFTSGKNANGLQATDYLLHFAQELTTWGFTSSCMSTVQSTDL